MTRKLTCLITINIILMFIFSHTSFANSDKEMLDEINNSDKYDAMEFKTGSLIVEPETGVIKFKNVDDFSRYVKADYREFVIDKNTYVFEKDTNALKYLLDRTQPWIYIHVLKEDNLKERESIHVAIVSLTFTDVAGYPTESFKKIFGRLEKLGIMVGDNDGFRPKWNITRAEMAKIIAVMRGGANTEVSCDFNDVSDSHWAKKYIGICKDLNIINGVGNNNFAPEEFVTYEQAIKMLVTLLGYTSQAEELGGYPTGYIKIAEREKIIETLKVELKDYATRENIATMINVALDVPLMKQTVSEQIQYLNKWKINSNIKINLLTLTIPNGGIKNESNKNFILSTCY